MSESPTKTPLVPLQDVVIVGASMVGATLACALALRGVRVTLIERNRLHSSSGTTGAASFNPLESTRFTVLSAATRQILDMLGLWSELSDSGLPFMACPVTQVKVSQQGRFGATRLAINEPGVAPAGTDALGYVISNDQLTACLHDIATRLDCLTLIQETTISELQQTADEVHLKLESSQQFSARLVVAADGAQSSVATLCGSRTRKVDYEQSAVLVTVQTAKPNGGTAFERFTPGGPLAVLPVADRLSTLVWVMPQNQTDRVCSLDNSVLLAELQQHFGQALGTFEDCGSRAVFPLALTEAEAPVHGRVVLLGNALRFLHPVAGQGFNLAVRDIGKLTELIGRQKSTDVRAFDPGNSQLLKAFVQSRKSDQQRTVAVTDTLARLFRSDRQPLALLRALGLVSLDVVGPVRRHFTRMAMGYGEPLPDPPPVTHPAAVTGLLNQGH